MIESFLFNKIEIIPNGKDKATCGEFTIDKTAPTCNLSYDGYGNILTLKSEKGAKYEIGPGTTETSGTLSENSINVTPKKDNISKKIF